MDFEVFLSLLESLEEEGVEYIIVGGVALNLHGLIRATEDIDLFVRPEPDNIEKLKRALRRIWKDPEIDRIHPDDLSNAYPTIRYGPPGEDFVIDLISRLGTSFQFDDIEVMKISVEGRNVRVATPSLSTR